MRKLDNSISRRSLLASTVAVPFVSAAQQAKRIPIGLELYSVVKEMLADLPGTVRAVAKMGYQHVEFIPSYFEWTTSYAKDARKVLDETGMRCRSTRNWPRSFAPENIKHTIELNRILGSKLLVLTLTDKVTDIDGWKKIAESLNKAAEVLAPVGMRVGYHNHEVEFVPLAGKRPMEIIASETRKDVKFEFDIGSCLCGGGDPVAWIEKNPGRFATLHLRDWSNTAKGYKVLLGAGVGPWKKIFQAAEKASGIEFYLIEQEGNDDYPPMETAQRCLSSFRKLHS